jgi:hypothetical protein
VRVSAVHTGNGGLVIEVSDIGLGMTESDLRVANTRLQSGGEVTPYTARHMGLFVVGRLAQQHGLVVRLRSTVAGEANSGTTAGVYVPSELIVRAGMQEPLDTGQQADAPIEAPSGFVTPLAPEETDDYDEYGDEVGVDHAAELPVGLLPQRNPGASGISGSPVGQQPEFDVDDERDDESEYDLEPWEAPVAEESPQAPIDTSAFFGARAQVATNGVHEPEQHADELPPLAETESSATAGADDAIYQKMLSEWLVDPTQLAKSSNLNWQSVWDHGWEAAEAAEEAPVQTHTETGLPIRDPGARLVPGAAASAARHGANGGYTNGGAHRSLDDDNGVESAAEFSTGAHADRVRDPEAVRASMSSHFGGVHAARSHAQQSRGTDNE